MNLKKTFIKNFTSLFFSTIVARLFSFIAVILIARYLGKHNFGIYSGAQAFAGIFVLFFSMGTETGLVYSGSKEKNTILWFFGSGIVLKVILGLCFFIIMIITAKLLKYSTIHLTFIIIIGVTVFLIQFQNFFAGVYQIHQKMEFKAIIDAGREILFLMILLVLIKLQAGIFGTATAELLSNSIFFLIALWFALRFVKPDFKRPKIAEVFKNSYLFALSGLFYAVYFQIDTVMLSIMRTSEETGIYAAAYKLPITAFIIPGIISIVTLPAMYESEVSDREVLKKIYFLRAKYLAILGLLTGLTFWFLKDQLITLLFGSGYKQAGSVLALLACFVPLRFVGIVSGDIVTTMGRQDIRTIIQGLAAAINVVLNIIMIPRFGIFGAAWATIGSELFLLVGYYAMASKLFLRLPAFDTFGKPILAAIVMTALFMLLKSHWLVNYAIGFFSFWIILIISGSFKNDPIFAKVNNRFFRA